MFTGEISVHFSARFHETNLSRMEFTVLLSRLSVEIFELMLVLSCLGWNIYHLFHEILVSSFHKITRGYCSMIL